MIDIWLRATNDAQPMYILLLPLQLQDTPLKVSGHGFHLAQVRLVLREY